MYSKNILKIYTKKSVIACFFGFIACDFSVAFINITKKNSSWIDSNNIQRFPNKNEEEKLKQDVIEKLNGQVNSLFQLQPQLRNKDFIHLSFPANAGDEGAAYIYFINKYVNPALDWSNLFHEHFQPVEKDFSKLACYPGTLKCKTIESNLTINGDWSIKDLIGFVQVLSKDIEVSFLKFKINVWNEFIKGALKDFVDKSIDSLSISDWLKNTLKKKVDYYSDANNLVNILKSLDPELKYNFKVNDWSAFSKKVTNISKDNIKNIKYEEISKNEYLMSFNLDLIAKGFLSYNGKDISNFDNQVTYVLDYQNDQFVLKDGIVAKNFFYNLFLQVLTFI